MPLWGPNRFWPGSGLVLRCLGPGFTVLALDPGFRPIIIINKRPKLSLVGGMLFGLSGLFIIIIFNLLLNGLRADLQPQQAKHQMTGSSQLACSD